jgi:hypothetical protein
VKRCLASGIVAGMFQLKDRPSSQLGSPPAVAVAQLPDGRVRLVAQLDVGGGQGRAHGVGQVVVPVGPEGGPQADEGLHDRGERLGRVAEPGAGRLAEPDDQGAQDRVGPAQIVGLQVSADQATIARSSSRIASTMPAASLLAWARWNASAQPSTICGSSSTGAAGRAAGARAPLSGPERVAWLADRARLRFRAAA